MFCVRFDAPTNEFTVRVSRAPPFDTTTSVAVLPPLRLSSVTPSNVGVALASMSCGSVSVTAPFGADTFTWLAVPASEVTPVLVIVTFPVAPLTSMPVPAVAPVTPVF